MPTFTEFFNGDWQRMLEAVEIPEMPGASWDRKAAYLLLVQLTKGSPEMAAAKGTGRGRKPAVNDSAGKIADALSFIKLAVSTSAPDDYEDMIYMTQGWAMAHDGVLAAGMPLGEQDIAGYVNHKLLTTAIGNVGKELIITSGDAGILIKSGDYEALVPHGDMTNYRPANPDQQQWPIADSDAFKAALAIGARVVKATAEHVRDAAIYNMGKSILATDGGSLVEAWHGNEMPAGLVFPRPFAVAIGKTDKKIVGFGFDQQTWQTFTVWFEDQSFIRTRLYPYADYPQSAVTGYAALFVQPHTIEPPKGFFDAVKAVSPFGAGKSAIACVGGAVVTSWDGSAWATAAIVKGLPDTGFYFSGNRALAWEDAAQIWFGDAQSRRMVFIGPQYRAMIAAFDDPMPEPAPAAAPGGWGAPPASATVPDPATAPAWGAPAAAAAPSQAAEPVQAAPGITMPYTPYERQPANGGLRGSPGWDRTPYTLQPGETVAQFVNTLDNEARALWGWPLNPDPNPQQAAGTGAPAFPPTGSVPASVQAPATPAAQVQTPPATAASPSEVAPWVTGGAPFPAGPAGAPTSEAPAPSTAPAATETAPATASPSDRPAWMNAGQQPQTGEQQFSFAAFNPNAS